MSVIPESERKIAYDWSGDGLALFRNVVGSEVEGIYKDIAILAARTSGIDLPRCPEGGVSPRAVIIKSKELRVNGDALDLYARYDDIRTGLKEDLPTLKASIPATLTAVDLHKSAYGDHFLSLLFSRQSADVLGDERADIWASLEEMNVGSSKELNWKSYDPDVRVAFFHREISTAAVKHIEKFVRKQLPLSVTLAPAFPKAA